MISIEEVEEVHQLLILQFGGSSGIRDKDSLASALARPFQTFDGKELYPDPVSKAACLIQSILSNHPFIDGNKRTGYVLMRLFLNSIQLDISATQDEKYHFVISIASGKSSFEEILAWITAHLSLPEK